MMMSSSCVDSCIRHTKPCGAASALASTRAVFVMTIGMQPVLVAVSSELIGGPPPHFFKSPSRAGHHILGMLIQPTFLTPHVGTN